jgi:DNA-binding XRE family transcriptional regulator
VARTQAVYYRDRRGAEPVDEFIQALPPRRAAKIDEFIEEHLNGRLPQDPPPPFPVTSQLDGELRELRARFANTRYRILYQRSENLVGLRHAIEKDAGAVPGPTSSLPGGGRRTSGVGWTRRGGRRRGRWARTAPLPTARCHRLIKMDKLITMTEPDASASPRGKSASDAAEGRAHRSQEYRAARDEYSAIRRLRHKNWIAAHIRERRYELDLTQQQVAERAGTSHSFISKLESGEHIPTIPVLKRILAVLDEQLLIGIERTTPGEEHEREIAPAPEVLRA